MLVTVIRFGREAGCVERWNAGAVARMPGVSPTTLRTRDGRCGLAPVTP